MRIAIITDAWFPQVNGVVRTLNKTITLLQSWGHEVLCVNPGLFRTVPTPTGGGRAGGSQRRRVVAQPAVEPPVAPGAGPELAGP